MEQKFYKCEHCGNIIAFVKDSGVPVMCCGQKMVEIIPGTVDAAKEKHIPVYSIDGNNIVVYVGAVEHPMTEQHYIEWVVIQTKKGRQKRILQPNDKPQACFKLCEDDELQAVYAYCNLHGLWKTEVPNAECALPTSNAGDYIVCNCNKVSYMDIVNALNDNNDITNVLEVFEKVRNTTHCSTGCGGCYDKVMAIISDVMNGYKN